MFYIHVRSCCRIKKKDFQFKKWSREIGGDLCVSHHFTLRGCPCTFYLNADAMGKSMQGAGGILVLGAVLDSIVVRMRHSRELQEQTK